MFRFIFACACVCCLVCLLLCVASTRCCFCSHHARVLRFLAKEDNEIVTSYDDLTKKGVTAVMLETDSVADSYNLTDIRGAVGCYYAVESRAQLDAASVIL